jgi:hypothetical protein
MRLICVPKVIETLLIVPELITNIRSSDNILYGTQSVNPDEEDVSTPVPGLPSVDAQYIFQLKALLGILYP